VRDPGSAKRTPWRSLEARSELAANPDTTVPHVPSAEVVNNMGRAVGIEMMTRFAVPFEVAGLLLTAAVIGAIALAQSETSDDDGPARAGVAVARVNGAAPSPTRTETVPSTTTSAT
jgi:NADH-quinone oxidoreductase subunit J